LAAEAGSVAGYGYAGAGERRGKGCSDTARHA